MAYTSWDSPVSNAELAQHYGTPATEPDTVAAFAACSAIRAIPAHRLTPAVAAAILAAISSRVAELDEAASQYVDDAIFVLEEA